MSRTPDYASRIDIVRTDPFVATLTFETDYSRSVVRVSRDILSRKYWVQIPGSPAAVVEKIADIDPAPIASAICRQAHRDRAERMGGSSVVVLGAGSDGFYIQETRALTSGELYMFAQHVIEEFDRRYVPWPVDVQAAVADGLRQMGEAA